MINMLTLLNLALLVAIAYGQTCDPASNCSPPDCRCFIDAKTPGGLSPDQVPQMIVVTMDYALNAEYKDLYDQLFTNNNPNGCPALGTFFLQDANTDYDIVKSYASKGFEIGISSLDGSVPKGESEWKSMIKGTHQMINNCLRYTLCSFVRPLHPHTSSLLEIHLTLDWV